MRSFSANRQRSRGGGGRGDEDEVRLALHRLLDKLHASQPFYKEEDVAVIPFPSEGSSPSHSPSRAEELFSTCGSADRERGLGDDGSHAASSVAGQKPPAASSTVAEAAGQGTAVDLDSPLSAPLFLTAVNLFEAKLILRNRRVAVDAVKLLRQGYALVWHDTQYIGAAGAGVKRATPAAPPEASPTTSPTRRSTSPPLGVRVGRALFQPSVSPCPTFQPDPDLVKKLDECVQVLLVYANNSSVLAQFIASSQPTLRLFIFICIAARQVEERGEVGPSSSSSSSCTATSSSTGVPHRRDVDAELARLSAVWANCGVAGRLVDLLRECYLIEFLLDAALPPAVCSARYDGLVNTLYDRKQRIILDMVASRQGFAAMMQVIPLRSLAGVVAMSAYSDVKLRARLLDKMAAEGVMDRLFDAVSTAFEEVLKELLRPVGASTSVPAAAVARKRGRPRGSGVLQSLSPPRPPTSQPAQARSPIRNEEIRAFGLPSPEPASAATGTDHHSRRVSRQSQSVEGSVGGGGAMASPGVDVAGGSAVERLGLCIDVLLLLTCPNLRPAAEAEEMLRHPKTAASAVVRSTVWASHEAALQGIITRLLWLAMVPPTHRSITYMLRALQEQAMECVLQVGSYSGCLYAMVVQSLDVLLETSRPGRQRSGSSTSLSPSRDKPSPPPECAEKMQYDARGVLPLLVKLLTFTTHAQANSESIQRWFQWLTEHMVPHAFEVPTLTNGRRSSSAWGRQRKLSKGGSIGAGPPAVTPVLARDLRRDEVIGLSSYFRFACRVVQETRWRDGAEAFFAKVALLAYHVVLANSRRCNMYFGQASACYDAVAPLLQPVSGRLPGEPLSRTEGEGNEADTEDTMKTPSKASRSPQAVGTPPSSSTGRKRRQRSTSGPSEGAGGGGEEAAEDLALQTFIPSPSRSPMFYEAYSPSSEADNGTSGDRSPPARRRLSTGSLVDDVSPESVTRSWRDRLSLRVFLSMLGGGSASDDTSG